MTGALNGGGGHGAPKLRLLQGRAALAHYGSALEYSEPRRPAFSNFSSKLMMIIILLLPFLCFYGVN